MAIKIEMVNCARCGNEWAPRVSEPKMCPRCHSLLWKKARTDAELMQAVRSEVRARKRPQKNGAR